MSRLEGFSDAVFGFSTTLLVISLEVPRSFKDLLAAMRGSVAFAVCFLVLFMIWERHYTYFRRYGLQDRMTLGLNGILLFTLLLYIYPLKFVFTLVFEVLLVSITRSLAPLSMSIEARNVPALFSIYGIGFAVVFGVFALLYVHAYAYRDALELSEHERLVTRAEIVRNVLTASIGLLCVLLANRLEPRWAGASASVFFLITIVETLHGATVGEAERKIRREEAKQTVQGSTPTQTRADYGIDAPGVVRNLAVVGAAAVVVAVFARLGPLKGAASVALCWTFAWTGASLLATAAVMVYGSRIGKLKERDRLLEDVDWRGDERVLDVGCGRGLMLTAAAKHLTTGRAVGVDIWQTEDQSGNCRENTLINARAEGVADRIEVVDGDARSLPFPDESFDVVVSHWALHNIYDAEERATAIREIVRVLKPGGSIALMDIRHNADYSRHLEEAGCTQVTLSAPSYSFLIPSRKVTATKPARRSAR